MDPDVGNPCKKPLVDPVPSRPDTCPGCAVEEVCPLFPVLADVVASTLMEPDGDICQELDIELDEDPSGRSCCCCWGRQREPNTEEDEDEVVEDDADEFGFCC